MTTELTGLVGAGSDRARPAPVPQAGSRQARLAHPTSLAAIRQVAAEFGVCVRPIPLRRTDLATGETTIIDVPCGATRESRCRGCAGRARRLRQQQCREGWHREDEPVVAAAPSSDQVGLILLRADFEYARADCLARGRWRQVAELDAAIDEVEALMSVSGLRGRVGPPRPAGRGGSGDGAGQGPVSSERSTLRRCRSTRRRGDVVGLPRRRVEARTVGRTFGPGGGRVFRPSTFVTVTLPSYGRVGVDGAPVDPGGYDYRAAAWDAVHFPALLDRLVQNLRRAEGWNVQYFATVEPQKRLAPHAHLALRGAIPRAVVRQVVAATYHQVWWPSCAVVVFPPDGRQPPVWDEGRGGYVDPGTGQPLPSWGQAMDRLDADPDAVPVHVVRFGAQLDIRGVVAGTGQADRLVGYLTKYLTKSVAECHRVDSAAAAAHQRRLWEQLRITPCSPRCANWLCYGIQPDRARPRQRPGGCTAKVHQVDTLGLGGRRVLVSRLWTGKTLAEHRYDQLAWVRQVLGVGLAQPETDPTTTAQVDAARAGGAPAPVAWQLAHPDDPDVAPLARRLLRLISTRLQHRAAVHAARAGPGQAPRSAISPKFVDSSEEAVMSRMVGRAGAGDGWS
jgi:hypothetical protein